MVEDQVQVVIRAKHVHDTFVMDEAAVVYWWLRFFRLRPREGRLVDAQVLETFFFILPLSHTRLRDPATGALLTDSLFPCVRRLRLDAGW